MLQKSCFILLTFCFVYPRMTGMRKYRKQFNDTVEFGRDGADLHNNNLRNWEVEVCPMSYERGGVSLPDPAYARLVASDTGARISKPFAVASYAPLSNARFLSTIEDAIGGAGHSLELIGTLAGRSKRFASFKLEGLEDFNAGGRDFASSIYFGDGLDQKTVWFYGFTTRCIQCMNRFSMSLRGACSREKHTSGLLVRLPEIVKIIAEAVGVQAEFARAFDSLTAKKVTTDEARSVFAGFIGNRETEKLATRSLNTVDQLTSLFQRGRGNIGDNRADVFSAVTDYYTHNSVGGERVSRAARQFESSEFGTGHARKTEMWDLVNDENSFALALSKGTELLKASI
jgi:hypothetical protein